jgi:hypothetical protein
MTHASNTGEGPKKMTGYDSMTGVFELTKTQANYWLRRTTMPSECHGQTGM